MRKRPGTVMDIRTGRKIAMTDDITEKFLTHVKFLVDSETEFYIVTGPCRHKEVRWCVDQFREMELIVVFDRQFPSDKLWIFEGKPEELGFSYAS